MRWECSRCEYLHVALLLSVQFIAEMETQVSVCLDNDYVHTYDVHQHSTVSFPAKVYNLHLILADMKQEAPSHQVFY